MTQTADAEESMFYGTALESNHMQESYGGLGKGEAASSVTTAGLGRGESATSAATHGVVTVEATKSMAAESTQRSRRAGRTSTKRPITGRPSSRKRRNTKHLSTKRPGTVGPAGTRKTYRTNRTLRKPKGSSRGSTALLVAVCLAALLALSVLLVEKGVGDAGKLYASALAAYLRGDSTAKEPDNADKAFSRAVQELRALRLQEVATQETLELLEQRRADISARAAQVAFAGHVASNRQVQLAQERLENAMKERDNMRVSLEAARLLRDLPPNSAGELLQQIRKESLFWDEEEDNIQAAQRELEAEGSVEKVLEEKKAELLSLKAALATSKRELRQLEALLMPDGHEASEAAAVDAAIESLADKKTQLLQDVREQTSKEEKYSAASKDMVAAAKDVRGRMAQYQAMLAVLGKTLSVKEADRNLGSVEDLTPQERELLRARQTMHRLKAERALLADEFAAVDDKQETVALNKALDALQKAVAFRLERPVVRRAEDDVKAAQRKLEEKQEGLAALQDLWGQLAHEVAGAEQRVQRCEEEAALFEESFPRKLEAPEAFAIARYTELTRKLDELEARLLYLTDEAAGFSADTLKWKPRGMSAGKFWNDYVEPLADTYLDKLKEVFRITGALRLAEKKASEELKRQRLVEELQASPFEELVADAAKGSAGEKQRLVTDRMRTDLRQEVEKLESLQQQSKEAVKKLRQHVARLAVSPFREKNPGRKLFANVALLKELARQEYYSAVVDSLKTKEGELRDHVRNCFTEAVWTAARRRALYGRDGKTLKALRLSHEKALTALEDRLLKVRERVVRTEEHYARRPSSKRSSQAASKRAEPEDAALEWEEEYASDEEAQDAKEPVVYAGELLDAPPEPDEVTDLSGGDLVGLLFKDVLQLNKPERPKLGK